MKTFLLLIVFISYSVEIVWCQHQWIFLHYHKTGAVLADAIASALARNRFSYHEIPDKRVDFFPRMGTEILLCHAGNFLFNWTETFAKVTFQSKVVHFVRDPSDMVLSGMLYHSQRPPSEGWLTSTINPCTSNQNDIEKFVSILVTYHSSLSKEALLQLIRRIYDLCLNIYQQMIQKADPPSYHKVLTSLINEQQEYRALQLEVCRSILSKFQGAGGDVLRMAANAVREGQTNNFGLSTRIFLSDFPLGNRSKCLNTVTEIFRFLLSPSSSGYDFWRNKIDLEQAIYIAFKASYVDQSFRRRLNLLTSDQTRFLTNHNLLRSQFRPSQHNNLGSRYQSYLNRSHQYLNPTKRVRQTNNINNHITQRSWTSERRKQLLSALRRDPDLSPIINLVQLILTYPLEINSTSSKVMTLIPNSLKSFSVTH